MGIALNPNLSPVEIKAVVEYLVGLYPDTEISVVTSSEKGVVSLEMATLSDAEFAVVLADIQARFSRAPRFLASSKLAEGTVKIVSDQDWDLIGGVVTTPDFFLPDLSRALGRVLCSVNGDGGQLRIIERQEDGTETDLKQPAVEVSDTAGGWKTVRFWMSGVPTNGTNEYRLEGRLNGATGLQVRFVTLSLLEK